MSNIYCCAIYGTHKNSHSLLYLEYVMNSISNRFLYTNSYMYMSKGYAILVSKLSAEAFGIINKHKS